MLNRHSGLPLYRQLVDHLEARLDREFGPGDRLPSESDLAAEYQVNRLTVRQAIAELSRRGLVEASQGRGTYVIEPQIRYQVSTGADASFTHAMLAAGHTVGLRRLRTTTDRDRALQRELRTRGPVICYYILRLVDDEPWSLTATWLPSTRYKALQRHWDGETSLFDALANRYGIRIVRATRSFSSRPADAVDAEQLMIPVGAPVLVVRGLNTTAEGDPVAVVEHHFRGDRVEFSVDLR